MPSHGQFAIGAGVLAAIVTAVGIEAARRRHEQVRRLAPIVVAFAAGVLVTASLTRLLPDALVAHPRTPLWALSGFVSMVLLSRLATGHVCDRETSEREVVGWLTLFGIGFHSFLDGLTYAVAFDASQVTGATVAIGMIVHELPEGLICYTILVRAGHAANRAALLAWLTAGLTTPLGAALAVPLLDLLSAGLRAVLVAIAGGVLLYVGAAHLLPQAERHRSTLGLVAFVAGVALALSTALLDG